MSQILFSLCMVNTIIIIIHEIDAAYWKEWKMFSYLGNWRPVQALAESPDQTGLGIFLLAHLPLLFLLLYGLVLISNGAGIWYSLLFSIFLIIHFIAHKGIIKKGQAEFTWPVSNAIFLASLLFSMGQLVITIMILK